MNVYSLLFNSHETASFKYLYTALQVNIEHILIFKKAFLNNLFIQLYIYIYIYTWR